MSASSSKPQLPTRGVSSETSGQLDSDYCSFPPFEKWLEAGVDQDNWKDHLRRLDESSEVASQDEGDQAREIILRAAAFDTGAVEGLYETTRGITLSVAERSDRWEDAVDSRNPGRLARALFDSQLTVYSRIVDAVQKSDPITEALVRSWHEELCRAQRTYTVLTPQGWQEHDLLKGTYKRYPNHVHLESGGSKAYAPVDRTPEEMHLLLKELHSAVFSEAHPVQQASYAHFGLVTIHPFADGNGRVGRALASYYLLRAFGLPFVLFADERSPYLRALELADEGRYQAAVDFFLERATEAMLMFTDTVQSLRAPSIDGTVEGLRTLLHAREGLTHDELDEQANKVLEALASALQAEISRQDLPPGVTLQVGRAVAHTGTPAVEGYRPLVRQGEPHLDLEARVDDPASATNRRAIYVASATNLQNQFALVLLDTGSGSRLDVRLRDVRPALTPAMTFRLQRWARRILAEMLAAVREGAEQTLRNAGYKG